MVQDPTDQHIKAILSVYDLFGKEVLEIGCGGGRITRDLAKHAARDTFPHLLNTGQSNPTNTQ